MGWNWRCLLSVREDSRKSIAWETREELCKRKFIIEAHFASRKSPKKAGTDLIAKTKTDADGQRRFG
jgi:hypothetical protein